MAESMSSLPQQQTYYHHHHFKEAEEDLEEPLLSGGDAPDQGRPAGCPIAAPATLPSPPSSSRSQPEQARLHDLEKAAGSLSSALVPVPTTLQDFLMELQLDKYCSLLDEHEVTLDALKVMSDEDLTEIGLPVGARTRIRQALARHFPSSSCRPAACPFHPQHQLPSSSPRLSSSTHLDEHVVMIGPPPVPTPHRMPSSSSPFHRPRDHTLLSLLSCVCCNPLCGAVALMSSVMVDELYSQGNIQAAENASRWAKICSLLACVTGFSTLILALCICAFYLGYSVLWSEA